MAEYENICRGAIGINPPLNIKKLSKQEWLEQLIANSAEYNKMSVDEVREYVEV